MTPHAILYTQYIVDTIELESKLNEKQRYKIILNMCLQ